MGKMKKIYEETFAKGIYEDDSLNAVCNYIVAVSHKPTEEDSELAMGDIGELSYLSVLEKKIKVVLYIEE